MIGCDDAHAVIAGSDASPCGMSVASIDQIPRNRRSAAARPAEPRNLTAPRQALRIT
jgi:hypothetical protein